MKKLIIITFVFLFLGCEKPDLLNPTDQVSKVELQISGLNAPGDSVWYECWLMWTTGEGEDIKNVYNTLGLLNNVNGNVYSTTVDVNPGNLQQVLNLVVTMEKDTYPGYRIETTPTSVDTFKGPSTYKIIAAKVTANSGTFNVGNDVILDFNFESAQAKYILDTPTDTTDTNLKRGIWFINLDTTFTEIKDSLGAVIGIDTTIEKKNGLELPELSGDWMYEAWVIFGSDTVSIGTFINPIGADDSSKYGAGFAGGYNFPGEDFISNPPAGVSFPTDLTGVELFVTIDPIHPENGNNPFNLIPFKTTIPANAVSGQVYYMDNNTSSFPTGNYSITLTIYD